MRRRIRLSNELLDANIHAGQRRHNRDVPFDESCRLVCLAGTRIPSAGKTRIAEGRRIYFKYAAKGPLFFRISPTISSAILMAPALMKWVVPPSKILLAR